MKKKKFKWPDFDKMSYEEEALVVRLQKDFKERLKKIAYQKGLNVSTLARMWLLERLRVTK